MRLARGILAIFIGYVCAAIAGSVALLVIAGLEGASPAGWPNLDEFVHLAALIAYIAATISLPVTIPVILFVEMNPKIGLKACLLGGLVLGIIMGAMLNWSGFRLGPMIAAISASMIGALTYWLISCFALAPAAFRSDSALMSHTI